jgi:hypothetical protein
MPSNIKALYLFETDKELKQHPSYVAAKAGDVGSKQNGSQKIGSEVRK